jgi:hypothetical protein
MAYLAWAQQQEEGGEEEDSLLDIQYSRPSWLAKLSMELAAADRLWPLSGWPRGMMVTQQNQALEYCAVLTATLHRTTLGHAIAFSHIYVHTTSI